MILLPFNFDRLENGNYFLSNMAGFHEFLEVELLQELISFSKTSSSLTNEQLQSNLFIAPDDSADASIAAMASGLAKKLQFELQFKPIFMIVPTLRCDHTCNYCQVSRASLNAPNYDLSEGDIPKIINTIKKLSDPPYKLEIQGGEPLVRFDLVKKIYNEAEVQLGNDNIEFVITSSLSLFNDTILSWAKGRTSTFRRHLMVTLLSITKIEFCLVATLFKR